MSDPAPHFPVIADLPRACPVPSYSANSVVAHPAWLYPILPGIALPNTVLHVSVRFCLPCQVLPGLAQISPALTDPSGISRSCPVLLDPARLCPVLAGAVLIQLAWRCPVRPCPPLSDPTRPWPTLHEPARSRPTLPILPWPTQPGSTLSCCPCTALTLHFPPLSDSADHARSCPALFGTDRPLLAPSGPVRPGPTLSGTSRTCHALPGPALHIPAVPSAQFPTLSDTVWPCPVCTNYYNCVFSCVQSIL